MGTGEADATWCSCHELTHFIENTEEGYGGIQGRRFCRRPIAAIQRRWTETRRKSEKTYEDAGLPCDVNKELAAAATEKLMASLGAWGRTGQRDAGV